MAPWLKRRRLCRPNKQAVKFDKSALLVTFIVPVVYVDPSPESVWRRRGNLVLRSRMEELSIEKISLGGCRGMMIPSVCQWLERSNYSPSSSGFRSPNSRSRSSIADASSWSMLNLATISRTVFSSSTCSVMNHCSSTSAANALFSWANS